MRRGLIIVLMAVFATVLPDTSEVHAAEQVVKLRRSYSEVSNQVFCESDAACNNSLFEVYTVQETNVMRDDLRGQIDSFTRQGGIVDQKINNAESRLMVQVKHVLDSIPQIMVSEQTREALKSAVLSVEREELDRIRHDMQVQIDDLKKQIEILKRRK